MVINTGIVMESLFEVKLLKIKTKKATRYYNFDDKQHRDNDLPAVIDSNGAQIWYRNGLRHRDNDLPAVIHLNGDQLWYQNGKLHRDNDLPASIWSDGTQVYWVNGEYIRSETT